MLRPMQGKYGGRILLTGTTSSSLRVPELRAVSWSSSDEVRFTASPTTPRIARRCLPSPCSTARKLWTRPSSGATPSVTPRSPLSDLFASIQADSFPVSAALSGVLKFQKKVRKMRRLRSSDQREGALVIEKIRSGSDLLSFGGEAGKRFVSTLWVIRTHRQVTRGTGLVTPHSAEGH